MANLYDKAGLVNIPVGYQDGFLYNIKPEDNTLGFRFNRDSAATRVNKEGLIEQVGYFGPELVQNGDFSQLGPELVVNGDFATDSDWIKGTGWSISGGSANGNNTTTDLRQENVVENGKYYKVTYTISNYVSGSVRFEIPSNIGSGIERSANGTYTEILKSRGTAIQFDARTSFTGSIDNVSVKQVDPNDYWTLGTGWSIEDGKAVATNAADAERLRQDDVFTAGKTYKVTYEITEISQGGFRGYVGGTNLTIHSTVGVYTETLVAPAIDVFYIRTVGTTSGSIENISVVEVLGDKPRIDYTDSLTSPSFLLEPQSTNLFPYSEDFSQWNSLNNAVVTDNFTTSPDGTKNASKFTFDGTVIGRVEKETAVTNGNEYTFSIWLKNDNLSDPTQVWLGLGTFGQGGYITVTNEWQRFTTTQTANGPNEYPRIQSNEIGSIFAWGAQFEQKSYATSYIPTAGSTVTRAQETCTGAGSASTFNDSEGVLYAEISSFKNGGIGDRTISINDGSTQNAVQLLLHNTANRINFRVRDGGSLEVNISDFTFTQDQINKIACKYKAGDYALWINGEQKVTTTSGSLPSGLSKLSFNDGSLNDFYGKTKGVYVFNEALTDDELQQLTGPEYNSFAALAAAYNYTVI